MAQTTAPDISRPKRASNGRQISESINGQQNGSAKTSLRIRSASVGRSRDYDLRCRYWAFLFDNLNRAVDEIYQNCEKDESIVECKEAVMVLDNYKREFTALIEWLNLNIDYESTPPPERPNSLTWEVRKSMPKQMTYWNTFFNKHSDIGINNSISKSFTKSDNHLNKSEEKENIETTDMKAIPEKQVPKPAVQKETTKPRIEEQPKEVLNSDKDIKISAKQPLVPNKSSVKTSASTPSLNTITTSSKPLNPLARSFKSRLHSVSSTTPSAASSAPAINSITTAPTPSTQTTPSPPMKKMTPIDQKSVPTKVANSSLTTNLIKRTVVSAPNLSVINSNIEKNNNHRNSSAKEWTPLQRKPEPKMIVPVINKNFIKETNSSRAKNVRNSQNQPKIGVRAQNNILSARNLNVNNTKNAINISNNKTKRVKDADGWEVVARGRQRYKASPPKVIIVEDESLVKTTADGTVIAVTAASQTTDGWDPMCGSWTSQTDQTELLRTPGKAIKLHEKLSSPSRKRNASPTESIKRHEEKLAKAQEAREKLLEKKAQKFKGIVKKVEEMKVRKEEQQMQLKASMELKLQRAEQKRQQQLNRIVRKAHDEDSKVNEILFINSLEAQNKKYDILSKEKDREMRLQDLQEERQRKMEEKQAKEAAAEERRKVLEEERQQRIIELQHRRRLKDQKIEQQFQEKEKERQEMATQKALDRQTRLSAINALYAQNKEELQKKIQQKQDESRRRHEENMAQIRQKALELSVRRSSTIDSDEAPICEPYDTCKMCNLCQVLIKSEVFLFGHLRGKKHLDAITEQNGGKIPMNEELENFNIKHIIEAPTDSDKKSVQSCDNERLKAVKKRSKKLKQRLITKTIQYETNCGQKSSTFNPKAIQSNNKNKISKLFKDLNTLSADTQITGQWPSNMIHGLERTLNELEKIFRQNSANDSLYFQSLNGIQLLTRMLARILNGTKERPTSLTDRANTKLATVYELICGQHLDVSDYVLQSNNMIELLDILLHRLTLSDTNLTITSGDVTFDPVIGALCRLLAVIFDSLYYHYSTLDGNTDDCLAFHHIIQDVISYIVSIGMIDKLSLFMSNTRGAIDEWPDLALFLRNIISFFSSISKIMTLKLSDKFGAKLPENETQLMITLQMTHICGVVSLIYGVLFHSGGPVRTDNDVPPVAAKHTLDLTLEAIRFLNYVSLLDLSMVQSVLSGEGLSLQLRHICSYLLWYCSHNKNQHLLNEVILLIGNFVVLNHENQTLIQSGQRPTVVQQLCCLPFEYFSDDQLSAILFPALIACCFNNQQNRTILEQEMSTLMLSSFIESTIVGLQLRAVDSQLSGKATPLAQQRLTFAKRFPKNRWNEAKDYFECQSRSVD